MATSGNAINGKITVGLKYAGDDEGAYYDLVSHARMGSLGYTLYCERWENHEDLVALNYSDGPLSGTSLFYGAYAVGAKIGIADRIELKIEGNLITATNVTRSTTLFTVTNNLKLTTGLWEAHFGTSPDFISLDAGQPIASSDSLFFGMGF